MIDQSCQILIKKKIPMDMQMVYKAIVVTNE